MNEELEQKVSELTKKVQDLSVFVDSLHKTNRLDIPLTAIKKKAIHSLIAYPVTVRLKNTDAATAANYGTFFTADKLYRVLAATEVHGTLGTNGSAVTLQIERLRGTQAPDGGTVLLSTAFDLKGTINTVQYGSFVSSDAVNLIKGDRLCLKDAGTLTDVANVQVTVYIMEY